MALHDDLLEQARHLALREPRRPRQASLRRAVSTAYYAIFHLLVAESATRLVPGVSSGLRMMVSRAFAHGDMKAICQQFATEGLDKHLKSLVAHPLTQDLRLVAEVFVSLQAARHAADYDLVPNHNRVDTLDRIQSVTDAFQAWRRIRKDPNTAVFLAALLLGRRWNR